MKLIEKIKDIIFKIKGYNRSADHFNKKFAQKILHNEPIYRVDILRAIKYNYRGLRGYCICTSISTICEHCLNKRFLCPIEVKNLFPKLSYSNANGFQLDGYGEYSFWWEFGDWKGGRMQFLDWLIEEYKDDKQNLRYIKI